MARYQVQGPDGAVHIIEGPDNATPEQIEAAAPDLIKNAASPSLLSTFGNAIVKGAAGLGDMAGQTATNLANLGIAGYGVGKHLLTGSNDLPDALPPDLLNGWSKIGHATGAIDDARNPTNGIGRVVDFTGQMIGGGGVNPAALARSAARGQIMPIVRDLVTPVLAGTVGGTAGELTRNAVGDDTTGGRLATMAASLLGSVGGGGVTALQGTAGERLSQATKTVTPSQWAAAKALEASSPVPLSGAESVQATAGANPALRTIMRVTEQSPHGVDNIAPVMAQRPAANQALIDAVAGKISPPEQFPDVLAGGLQNAATGVIKGAQGDRTAAVSPFYQGQRASDTQAMNLQNQIPTMQPGPALNAAQAALAAKNLPAIKSSVDGLLANLDQQIKIAGPTKEGAILQSFRNELAPNGEPIVYPSQLESIYRDNRNKLNPGIDPTPADKTVAGVLGPHVKSLDALIQQISPDISQGRGLYAQLSRDVVDPLQASQVGKLARSDDFSQQAETLLPKNPLDVTPAVVDRTISQLGTQDPDIARRFLAQALRSKYSSTDRNLQTGENQWSGNKFANEVAGNDQQRQNLMQAVQSAAGPGPTQALADALKAWDAQAHRPQVGSATAFNAAEQGLLSGRGVTDAIIHPLTTAGNIVNKFRLGSATKDLADALVPGIGSVEKMHELARASGAYSPMQQLIAASLLRQ